MLPTKNYKRAFDFVEVIIRNIAFFFHPKYSENGIFDDVVITSALHYITMDIFDNSCQKL